MPTLDTTIGGTAANSYCTVAETDIYFDSRLNSTSWANAVADDKICALIMAAARLNEENWRGCRVTSTQALAWPRYDVEKKDAIDYGTFGYGGLGWYEWYPSNEIPKPVKTAQQELAISYLEGFDDGQKDQISSFSTDGVSVSRVIAKPQGALPAAVSRLLSGLILGPRLARG
jgi:hypothetical protein